MRILCFCFFILSLLGCQKEQPSSKPIVLVSIPSYLYFIERIAGDSVTAFSLTPEGANPHTYEPTPKEAQKFRQALLWVRLGEPTEEKIYTILKQQNPQMRIIDITEGIPLIPLHKEEHHCCADHAAHDLHIWLSPRLSQIQAKTIAKHLSELFPENKQKYDEALKRFLLDLQNLDNDILALFAKNSPSAMLVSHPAFSYFCLDYHLTQLSIEVEGKDPLPQDVTHLVEQIKTHKLTHVIAEPQYSNKAAQLIAEHFQLPLSVVDPYSQDYLKNLEHLAELVAKS